MTSFNGRGVSSTFPARNMQTVAIVCQNKKSSQKPDSRSSAIGEKRQVYSGPHHLTRSFSFYYSNVQIKQATFNIYSDYRIFKEKKMKEEDEGKRDGEEKKRFMSIIFF